MSVKTILRYLANHAHLNSLIFLSINLQGQTPLDLLDSFAVINDNDEFAKELIDKGFTLDYHEPEDYERQLTKEDLRIGLIDGPGDCKYIIMKSDNSAIKCLSALTFWMSERMLS